MNIVFISIVPNETVFVKIFFKHSSWARTEPSENIPNEKFAKLSSITNSNSSQIFNKHNFNPLLYDFDFESFESQIYRVDGTDYIINIIPKRLK